ncbi:peptidoglycan-binding protein [Streptomyces griseofuscus]|uniref:peptidoglycan-binding protein n=1 Tax=Streptomyces griseofuscus TaxID=146922 RepID=UPI003828DAE9
MTKLNVRTGDTFRPGRSLLEVSGRPVIALQGTLPVYRDLKPGTEGNDVAQLQKALATTGHPVTGDRTGFFGPGTKSALNTLYHSIGYDPLPAVPDSEDTETSAQDAVTDARRHLQDVQSGARDNAAPGHDGNNAGEGATGVRSVDLSRAREDLARAEKKLADAKAKSGPTLPSSEVVYVKGFPARVDDIQASVGSQVSGTVMTVSAGRLVVRGFLSREQHTLVHPGQQVQILSELDGTTAAATVRSVANTVTLPQADGQNQDARSAPDSETSQGFAVTVTPDKPLPVSLAGQDVRLTIQTAATSSKVLVVPVTAVSAGADGATAVTVAVGGESRRRVPVVTGASGDGYVEVRPVHGARLGVGEKVITGIGGPR